MPRVRSLKQRAFLEQIMREEKEHERERRKAPLVFDEIHTRGVLAGAYRGKRAELEGAKTHLVYRHQGVDVRTGCRQPLYHIADQYSAFSEEELHARPTCPTCAKKWDKLKGLKPNATLYRATEQDETEVYPGSCWSEDLETARAYTEEGVGHGGANVRSIEADTEKTLDITTSKGRPEAGFRELAEALGYEDPDHVARQWHDNGWLYPWEESKSVKRRLEESGYEWLRYNDDYPEGAVTMMRIV